MKHIPFVYLRLLQFFFFEVLKFYKSIQIPYFANKPHIFQHFSRDFFAHPVLRYDSAVMLLGLLAGMGKNGESSVQTNARNHENIGNQPRKMGI